MVTNLAVVLISKNQEWNIARLIESVLEGTAGIHSKEIVLVDSASVDDTIDIASNFEIKIIRLHPNQPLTPAAGRYVGYQHTSGELVLFLDGDMELCQGWMEKAVRVIQDRPEVGVITGQIVDLRETAEPDDKPTLGKVDVDAASEVSFGGGAAMYRRSVLEQVGSFNPYLYSDEEPELCLRIRHAGYRVLQLEYPIAYHYSSPSGALSTLVERWRRNLYLGAGQNIRYHLGDELLWPYLKERGYGFIPGLGLTGGLISFLWSLITRQWQWLGLWLLLLCIIIAGDSCRKRNPYRTLYSLLHRTLVLDGTVRGFLLPPLDPHNYPSKLDIIREGKMPSLRLRQEKEAGMDETVFRTAAYGTVYECQIHSAGEGNV